MKKVLLTLSAVALATSVFAQGTITFTTFSSANGVNAKVFMADGNTPLSGNNYLAQLLAAPGQNALESALVLAPGTTTFRTGTAAGYVNLTTVTLTGVPADNAGGATVRMVAWDNTSGLYPTWASAQAAYEGALIAGGLSPLLNITQPIGGAINSPPYLTGLASFNIALVPEPSTFALAGLGAAAMLIFRRRK